jgi:Domain of unknown function (DUF4815)
MTSMPEQYFSRFDPADNYDEHLFIAGRGLQSAELNEIQKNAAYRLKGVGDALFKDGDVVRDAGIVVNASTGEVQCQSGAIYIRGAVRGVAPATLAIPTTGVVSIGIRLVETVITSAEDPDLKDPATGTRNYNEPGADRLRVVPTWSTSTGGTGEYFPVYSVTEGVLDAKEPPPSMDAVAQALARYDRDSAGGSYVVSGLSLSMLPDSGGNQVYSLAEGRARVFGYGLEFSTARRLLLAATPDLKPIANEPHLSSTSGSQRINFDRTPGTNITEVSITAEKTVTLTHGVVTGSQDPLPDTSVLSIVEVKQGGTTYTPTTDYLLTAGKVDWTPAGAEPAPGSTYTVKYQYLTNVTPTAVDDNGFTVTGAISGTLVLVTYSQKLPRVDRLCLNTEGTPVWLLGVSAEFNPQFPAVPADMLAIASVYQTWTSSRRVVNDGVRVVPMPQLAAVDSRMDLLLQLIAQQRLESNIHTREGGTKKGLFTDPFLDDSQRDAGTAQTAAIVRGELQLPIAPTVLQVSSDIAAPTTLTYSTSFALSQTLRTGSMAINPYMAFAPVPAALSLTPSVDRWTVVDTSWASATTSRFVVGAGNQSSATATTRNALLSSTTSQIETLRPITVSYSISGFGPGENLSSLTFDGISRPVAGVTANASGVATGSFTIPTGVPSGNKEVVAIGASGNRGSAVFSGQGTLERQVWQQQTTITETRWQSPPPPTRSNDGPPADPLAQTFTLTASTQVAGIDLWFVAKPTTTTSVQIRSTIAGVPSSTVLAEAVIQPAAINIGGNHTRLNFQYPVQLLAGTEYAIVVLCNDPTGSLGVAELGKFDANAQRWITSQPYTVGVLLSSSNASTWTPHQDRDMTFRILRADFTQTQRTISLGQVTVANATDLLLMSYAERPASQTGVQYRLTLPDTSVITVDDGQPVQLAAEISGNIGVQAVLTGDAAASPVLFPGTQVVAGRVATTGDYVSRAVPGGSSVTVKVIFEAQIPSGAGVTVSYKGPDAGDTWGTIAQTATRAVDDGFTEFTHTVTGVNEASVQVKLAASGTAAARPRFRDLRVIVL